jgi:hypothetical protein
MRVTAMAALAGITTFWFGTTGAFAGAEVKGVIYKKGDPRPISGLIRALPSSRKYVVTQGSITMEIDAYTVERVETAKPPEFDAAVRQASSNPMAAVAPLKKIVDDYKMFPWGVAAGRFLIDAYIRSKQPAEAVRAAEAVIADDFTAKGDPEFLTKYWEAMIAADRDAGLESSLTEAIQKGPREVAAVAFVKRGDIQKKKGNAKEALISGYLRATELFKEVKVIQPEALFKAAQCFEEIGMGSQSERMRARLRSEFGATPWAERLATGK